MHFLGAVQRSQYGKITAWMQQVRVGSLGSGRWFSNTQSLLCCAPRRERKDAPKPRLSIYSITSPEGGDSCHPIVVPLNRTPTGQTANLSQSREEGSFSTANPRAAGPGSDTSPARGEVTVGPKWAVSPTNQYASRRFSDQLTRRTPPSQASRGRE